MNRKIDKDKYRFLQQIHIILHEATSNNLKRNNQAKHESNIRGALTVTSLANKLYRHPIEKIKRFCSKRERNVSNLVINLL